MKLIDLEIDIPKIEDNLAKLSDITRLEIFNTDEEIFNKLDYSNDNIFLEPSLFFFIFEKANNSISIELKQLLWGYIDNDYKSGEIDISTDSEGRIYLPNLGYFIYLPNKKLQLKYTKEGKYEFYNLNEKIHPLVLIKNIYLSSSNIKLCQHKSKFLENECSATFNEPIEETLSKYRSVIDESWVKLKKIAPNFCSLIQMTTREIFLFDCENQNSFAAMSYFGAIFINVNNQEVNEVFLIDDLSHQCGHIIFYALVLDAQELFLCHPGTLLSDLFSIADPRTIYDAFHGLFTYTTVLFSLEKCYDSNIFSKIHQHEIIGRIGFYLQKFEIDLNYMRNAAILSKQGVSMYKMFEAGFTYLYKKFNQSIANYSYQNQDYFFNYKQFKAINSD
ncbi:MAG: hypothetical protein IPJ81_06210 [Chitinophagaceae bacterium]|nr:hypothetical protein [Chitinophagaceae bacterium]